ncbi:SlyX family protein [Catenovulum adriaticum]|uniref:Protein SlyX homolog n=1 Tax=Catenovulum adriaticum TaxID=2984846 RepID=A0ABY7ALC9_9ALTE|nr:SlyX family protein [Catenovulum sp. TS8]WAJ69966.1 SlyX family protein [Catenovulum sp. TS8]
MSKHLEQRIDNLETQIIFQEDMIESLNQALIDQQDQLLTLQRQLTLFAKKVQAMQPEAVGPQSQEPPPPHY